MSTTTEQKTVTAIAPEGVTNASVAGVSYTINEHGHFVMLLEHAAALVEHGFKIVVEEIEKLIDGEKTTGEDAPAATVPVAKSEDVDSSIPSDAATTETPKPADNGANAVKPVAGASTDADPAANTGEFLIGSSVHPSIFTMEGGDTMQLGEVVQEAYKRTGATAAEWNALSDADRESFIQSIVDELPLKLAKAEDKTAIEHLENEGGPAAEETPEAKQGGDDVSNAAPLADTASA